MTNQSLKLPTRPQFCDQLAKSSPIKSLMGSDTMLQFCQLASKINRESRLRRTRTRQWFKRSKVSWLRRSKDLEIQVTRAEVGMSHTAPAS